MPCIYKTREFIELNSYENGPWASEVVFSVAKPGNAKKKGGCRATGVSFRRGNGDIQFHRHSGGNQYGYGCTVYQKQPKGPHKNYVGQDQAWIVFKGRDADNEKWEQEVEVRSIVHPAGTQGQC